MTLDCVAPHLFSFVFHSIKWALALSGHQLQPLLLDCAHTDSLHQLSCTRNSRSRFLLDVHMSLNPSLLKHLICGHASLSCCSVSHIYRPGWLRGVLREQADVIGRFTLLWWPIWWNGGKCDEPALCRAGWTLAVIPSIASHPSPSYSLSLISPHHFCSFCCSSCQSASVFHFCLPYPSLFPAPSFLSQKCSRSAAPGLFGCW